MEQAIISQEYTPYQKINRIGTYRGFTECRTSYCELVPQGKVVAHIHRGFWRDTGTPVEYHA